MVNLLWTGGWDSTFRLLQLAASGTEVQPHYIRIPYRESSEKEIRVMNEIRKKMNKNFPKSFVRKIEMIDEYEIIVYQEFRQAYRKLLLKSWIGPQYVHLASYCKQKKIEGMELSIERLSNTRHLVMPCLENTEIDVKGSRVISGRADKDLLCLFGQFSFPILSLTKLDMLEDASKSDFLEILNTTWFCHRPLFDQPCGTCNPCMSTLEAGHGYRFSALSLFRYKLKKTVVRHPKVHLFLRKLRYGRSNYL